MAHLVSIKHLYISPGHNFFGRYGREAGTLPMIEREEVRCVSECGIEGDRFYNFKSNYKRQITLFAEEVYLALCGQFDVSDRAVSVFRRNVVTQGVALNEWIGRRFAIGEVVLEGTEECRPCPWMEEAFAPGAEAALKGRGGLRARVLSDGVLRAGEMVWREV